MWKWELETSRLTKVVRDNGANVVKACEELNVDHFGCVAHSLRLVVPGALAKTREEVNATMTGEEEEISSFNDAAEPEEGEEQWEEDPAIELQAIDELERMLEDTSLENTVSLGSDDESVDLETDDCLDEGLLDGCLSTHTAKKDNGCNETGNEYNQEACC
ncbi:hypothetical protein PI124_g14051 [Phytophthora idaei]|nr:hypothetical protein PI125_g11642 [Phytophthora idaei]KAG3147006.1 hypothetical protein PI126_g13038 [Phytophthora idaei]KAG3241058.1 hypothetical protein PI124_g14051 [Phytophthora idaei]